MADEVNVGDVRRLEVTNIRTEAGVVTDPTALTLTVKKPDGTSTVYTYTVGPTIVRDSLGNYHANIDLDSAGWWRYSWIGTGAAAFAEGGRFRVFVVPTG